MKFKKFFILGSVAIASIAMALFAIKTTLTTIVDDGYMVPANNSITLNLQAGKAEVVSMVEVCEGDEVFKQAGSYLVGEDRTSIDIAFPEYLNGGNGLRFLDDEIYLITDDLYPFETYDGLYVYGGLTFNEERYLADQQEFIFLQLPNDLYIVLQDTVLETSLGDVYIPMNSIMYMDETVVRWYEFKTNGFTFDEEENVNNATIVIGDDEYAYADLLKALGLVKEATDKKEKGEDPTRKLEEADQHASQSHIKRGDSLNKRVLEINENGGKLEDKYTKNEKGGKNKSKDDVDKKEEDQKDQKQKGENEKEDHESKSQGGTTDATGGEGKEGQSGITEGEKDDTEDNPGEVEDLESWEYEYEPATVRLDSLEIWTYAINAGIYIKDDQSNITKGVTVTIYKKYKGELVDTGKKVFGLNTYSSEKATGRSTALRTTTFKTNTFNMYTLTPNEEYYLQISYKYQYWTGEYKLEYDENNKLISKIAVMARTMYYSDLIKFKTLTFEESGLKTVNLTFDVDYATYSTAMSLSNLKLTNTSGYKEGDDSFANFKLNSLLYVNKLIYTVVPYNAKAKVTLTASTSVVNKAKSAKGTTWKSSSSLNSNSQYIAQVYAMDKNGNIIPLTVFNVDYKQYNFEVYTCKASPVCYLTQVSNEPDKFTFTVTVKDVDDSLLKTGGKNNPLTLQVINSLAEATELVGSIDGVAFTTNIKTLTLDNPYTGRVYTIELQLPFSKSFIARVNGGYDLTPIVTNGKTLDKISSTQLGFLRFYTASMQTGNMYLNSTISKLGDTSATFVYSYSNTSTVDLIKMINDVRITVRNDDTQKVVKTFDLLQENLDIMYDSTKHTYDTELGGVVIVDGGVSSPTVVIMGTESQFKGNYTLWELMFPQVIRYNDDNEPVFSSNAGLQVEVIYPDKFFSTDTVYVMDISNLVLRGSGNEYTIPTSLTTSSFTTKKIQPTLEKDEIFIAGEQITFIGLWVKDPDETIEGGAIQVVIKNGENIIGTSTLTANSNPVNLTFDDLVAGESYKVELIAERYNDTRRTANVQTMHTILEVNFKGSEYLSGSVDYDYLTYSGVTSLFTEYKVYKKSAILNEIETLDEKDFWKKDTYYVDTTNSDYIDIPKGATLLRLEGYTNKTLSSGNRLTYNYFEFIDKNGKATYYGNSGESELRRTACSAEQDALTVVVPENATKFRVRIININEISANLTISYSTITIQNMFTTSDYANYLVKNTYTNSYGNKVSHSSYSTIYQYPVHVGDAFYFFGAREYSVSYYDQTKKYMYAVTCYFNSILYIPEGVCYVSFNSQHGNTIYYRGAMLLASNEKNQFDAKVSINVTDKKGYLKYDAAQNGLKGFGKVTLNVYKSDNYEILNYDKTQPYKTFDFSLVDNKNNTFGVNTQYIISQLPGDSAYQLELCATYLGIKVTLYRTEFKTDKKYDLITCEDDFDKITRNRFGNFIVTNDIIATKTTTSIRYDFYGTLDFQGHQYIVNTARTKWLFDFLGANGEIKNMVYVVNYTGLIRYGFVQRNYGYIHDIKIVINKATYTDDYYYLCFYENYGKIEKFIVEFYDDITCRSKDGNDTGSVSYFYVYNYGILQDGYMYSPNGSDVIYYTDRQKYSTGSCVGLFYFNGQISVTRRIYTIFDLYYGSDVRGNIIGTVGSQGYIENLYHVGEYYTYTGTIKTSSLANRVLHYYVGTGINGNIQGRKNIYALCDNAYTNGDSYSTIVDTGKAMDVNWQKDMLEGGGNFSAEKYVKLGYYPRLNLEDCMKKYQSYIPIVQTEKDTPSIVSDCFGKDSINPIINTTFSTYTRQSAYIVIRFQTTSNITVHNISFKDIDVDKENGKSKIYYQGFASDGLYDVVVKATATDDRGYFSTYTIDSFDYSKKGATSTVGQTYKTKNISFWKEVTDSSGWNSINKHMNWNYHLNPTSSDGILNLSDLLLSAVTINGNISNYTSTGGFSGKIDGLLDNGNLCVISGIKINCERPWVIYYLSDGALLSNFVVRNMTITGTTTQTVAVAGFVGYAYTDTSHINNVHIEDSTITAAGAVGPLCGQMDGYITNCSVTNTTVKVSKSKIDTYLGGMVGKHQNILQLRNCYCIGVTINGKGNTSVRGAAGLVGANTTDIVLDSCYAIEGSITTESGYVGGLVVDTYYGRIRHCISDIDINSTTQSGGISAQRSLSSFAESFISNSFVAGNIVSSSSDTHRVSGGGGYYPTVYGYVNQTVNAITGGDGVFRLLTAKELRDEDIWVDKIQLGDQYDYSSLAERNYPKLLNSDTGEVLYGQIDILMPGQGNEVVLNLRKQELQGPVTDRTYYVEILVTHPGLSTEEAKKEITISCSGLGITDADIDDGNASIAWVKYVPEANEEQVEKSVVVITSKILKQALDMYKFDFTYLVGTKKTTTTTIANFGPIYWTVSSMLEWEQIVANHKEGENIKITKMLDFENQSPITMNINLNRLECDDDELNCGFKNMILKTNTNSDLWIAYVAYGVNNIKFENCTFDFTDGKTYMAKNGAISYVAKNVDNIEVINCTVKSNYYTGAYTGIFGHIAGSATNIKVTGSSLFNDSLSTVSFLGIFAGNCGSIRYVEISDCSANVNNGQYVGTLCGYSCCNNITGTNLTVTGNTYGGLYYGGVTGGNGTPSTGINLNKIRITTPGNYCGGFTGTTHNINNSTINDVIILQTRENKKSSASYCGGVSGTVGGYSTYKVVVSNVIIDGAEYCGGVSGNNQQQSYDNLIINVQLLNCRIAAGGYTASYGDTRTGTYLRTTTIRNLKITNTGTDPFYAGGIVGTGANSFQEIYGNFVAEDVILDLKGNCYAGGMWGMIGGYRMYDNICAAQITIDNTKAQDKIFSAGGLIGYVTYDYQSNTVQRYIKNCLVATNISGYDYVSGVIGFANTSTTLNKDDYQNIVVVGDYSTAPSSQGIINVWLNSNGSVVTNDANIIALESTTLNGETLNAIMQAATATQITSDKLCTSLKLVTAKTLATKAFYQDKFKTNYSKYWFADHMDEADNLYYPYLGQSGAIYKYANKDYEGNTVGIPLPSTTTEVTKLHVYASSAYTINIESNVEDIQLQFGSAEPQNFHFTYGYGPDGNKVYVATLTYLFNDDIKVGDTTYYAANLARTIHINSKTDYWYYIENGDVYYGTRTGGLANYYSTPSDEALALAKILSTGTAVNIFNDFVLLSDGTVSQVVADVASVPVSMDLVQGEEQKLKPLDQFELTSSIGSEVIVKTFGSFSLIDNIKTDCQIFTHDESQYTISQAHQSVEDGLILSSTNTAQGRRIFFAYLRTDGTLVSNKYGLSFPTTSSGATNIAQLVDAHLMVGSYAMFKYKDGHVEVINYSTGKQIYNSKDTTASLGSYFQNIIDNLLNSFNPPSILVDDSYEYAENLESLINSTDVQDDLLGSISEQVKTADSLYVIGEGLYVNGQLIYNTNEAQYVDGEGVYVDGQLIVKENGSSSGEETSIEVDGKVISTVASITREDYNKISMSALGNSIVMYDNETGSYIVQSTKDLLEKGTSAYDGDSTELHDSLLDKVERLLAEGKLDPSKFNVKYSGLRTMNATEANGTILYVLASLLALATLAIIYFVSYKKKKALAK